MCSRQQRSPERLHAVSRFVGATGLFLPTPLARSRPVRQDACIRLDGTLCRRKAGMRRPRDARVRFGGRTATRRSPVVSRARIPPSGGRQGLCRCADDGRDDDASAPATHVERVSTPRTSMPPAPSTPTPHAPSWRDDPPGSIRLRTMGTATPLEPRTDDHVSPPRSDAVSASRRGSRRTSDWNARAPKGRSPVLANRRRHTRRTTAGSRAQARLPAFFVPVRSDGARSPAARPLAGAERSSAPAV